jgi:tetratricopeptide (TPR) repeat protein
MRVQPTADACTYLAYTREAYEGRFEEAVGACKRAIDLDPGFGNAYNDLGLVSGGGIGVCVWCEEMLTT